MARSTKRGMPERDHICAQKTKDKKTNKRKE